MFHTAIITMSILLSSIFVESIQIHQEMKPKSNYFRGISISPNIEANQEIELETEFGRSLQKNSIEDECGSPYLERNEGSNECSCKPGFSGYNCTMCQSDDACESVAPFYLSSDDHNDDGKTLTGTCEKDALFRYNQHLKSYDCKLDESLTAVFEGIDVAVLCDTKQGDCSVAFHQQNLGLGYVRPQPSYASCKAEGCVFEVGSPSVECEEINCICSESCDDFARAMFQDVMVNQPVNFIVNEDGGMVIDIPKSILPIKAQCNIASCAFTKLWSSSNDDEATFRNTISEKKDSSGNADDASSLNMKTVSGILLLLLLSLSVSTIIASLFFSFISHQSKRKAQIYKADGDDDDDITMVNTSNMASFSITSFEWENISCRIGTNTKTELITSDNNNKQNILHNVSGKAACGSVLGILGPSGSGKSTLLNVLYGISNDKTIVSGQVSVNGKQYHSKDLKNICAYVHQDDCLFPNLTVRECIEYSALLRLPTHLSLSEKLAKVEKVIQELHLEGVSNNRIGSSFSTSTSRSRVSGGERKRVSIGMELVTSPQILFLDEPTSGLDSYTSHSILKTLKELASNGRTVILSIHQPNAKTFNLIDHILLLYKGKTMYNSSRGNAVREFAKYGFVCPKTENVADFMLDVISDQKSRAQFIKAKFDTTEDLVSQATHSNNQQLQFVEAQENKIAAEIFNSERRSICSTFFAESPIMLQRAGRNIVRNKALFVMHLTISLILGLCGGYVFSDVEDNLAGFQNRTGAFYFMLTFFAFSSFSSMDAFINERRIFVKETSARYYSVLSYFVAKTALDIVTLRVIPITVFACIFYWIMGLQASFSNFMIFLTTLICFNIAAGSISVCISVFSSSVGTANLVATVVFLFMLLFGGFLVNVTTLPAVIGWFKYLSIFNYAFEILLTNELQDTVLSFDAPGYPSIPVRGTVFLETLNLFVDNQMKDLLALCAMSVVFNTITYIRLKIRVS